MVSELSDIGWLYTKITENSNSEGFIGKALNLAVQEEMNQYYKWLAIMENMIKEE